MSLIHDLRILSIQLDADGDFDASMTIDQAMTEIERLTDENNRLRKQAFLNDFSGSNDE